MDGRLPRLSGVKHRYDVSTGMPVNSLGVPRTLGWTRSSTEVLCQHIYSPVLSPAPCFLRKCLTCPWAKRAGCRHAAESLCQPCCRRCAVSSRAVCGSAWSQLCDLASRQSVVELRGSVFLFLLQRQGLTPMAPSRLGTRSRISVCRTKSCLGSPVAASPNAA